MLNPVAPYQYLLPTMYFFVADITNPDLFACSYRTYIRLNIARFYQEPLQLSSIQDRLGKIMFSIDGGGTCDTIYHTTVMAPPHVGCVVCTKN